jgi:Ca2+-binding RTX toxin-like protein
MAIINGTDAPEFINGTDKADQIFADGGDDTIFGSFNPSDTPEFTFDLIIPGEGIDTLDYNTLGNFSRISLSSGVFTGAIIEKFGANDELKGRDINAQLLLGGRIGYTLITAEKVIAPAGGANSLSGVRKANLLTGDIVITNDEGGRPYEGLSDTVLNVENFVNITGTDSSESDELIGNGSNNIIDGLSGEDSIQGEGGDDTLIGGSDNDNLSGGMGDDRLTGCNAENSFLGDEKDILTGGDGADRFVLRDARKSAYALSGANDFATITDFGAGDAIELSSTSRYKLQTTSNGFQLSAMVDGKEDLIANVIRASMGNSLMKTNELSSIDSLPGSQSDGTFEIAAGQVIGSFVGA